MPRKSADNILTVLAKTVGSAIGTIANTVGATGNGAPETQAAPSIQPKKSRPKAEQPKAHTKTYVKKKATHKRKIKQHPAG